MQHDHPSNGVNPEYLMKYNPLATDKRGCFAMGGQISGEIWTPAGYNFDCRRAAQEKIAPYVQKAANSV